MHKKSIYSYLRRKMSTSTHSCIIDEKTKVLLQGNKGDISSAASEGLKLALYYTAIPDNTALTPVPTPPPSHPKNSFNMPPEDVESYSVSHSSRLNSFSPMGNFEKVPETTEFHCNSTSHLRPTSTHSLPSIPVCSPLRHDHRSYFPSPPSTMLNIETEDQMVSEESTLDRGVRPRVSSSSPCPYSSTESLKEEEGEIMVNDD